MPRKQLPFIVRIQAEGTAGERKLIGEELREKVSTFNSRLERSPVQMRLDALQEVIDRVKEDPSELDFLRALLRTGKWSKEVAVLLGQLERLEILKRLKG